MLIAKHYSQIREANGCNKDNCKIGYDQTHIYGVCCKPHMQIRSVANSSNVGFTQTGQVLMQPDINFQYTMCVLIVRVKL